MLTKPAERYRAIGNILGIESLDIIELRLKNIRDDIQSNYKTLTNNYGKIKYDLSKILDTQINKISDIFTALNDYLEKNNFSEIESLGSIQDYSKE